MAIAIATTASQALAQQQLFTITLSSDQLNVVGKALGKLPYEEVQPVVDAIMAQVQQTNAKAMQEQKKAFDAAVEKAAEEKAKAKGGESAAPEEKK